MSTETEIELEISGMTCASCAARVEKNLNEIDGVDASVNYATEKARIQAPDGIDPDLVLAAVAKTGYRAALGSAGQESPDQSSPRSDGGHEHDHGGIAGPEDDRELGGLRTRLTVSILLAVPVIAMSMFEVFQFDLWQWVSLILATPVVTWGAWPFHRAALQNLRHGATTMDTLISMGVSAAFLWSLYALFFGTAGEPGMTHPFEISISPTDGASNIYLEVAAGVTMFLLAGRYFEVSSK